MKNQCRRDIENFKDIFEGLKTTPLIMTVLKYLTFFTARQEKTLTHFICKVRKNTLYVQNKIHYTEKEGKSQRLYTYTEGKHFYDQDQRKMVTTITS